MKVKILARSQPLKVVALSVLICFSLISPEQTYSQRKDSSSTVIAGSHYLKNRFHRFWWGTHYRKVWATPEQVPYFHLDDFRGGIEPIQMGGSFQTKNLRLLDKQGHEYVLRSIDKDLTRALPVKLQKTFMGRVMQDQTSVIHPYGAFIVGPLADAAGVYHTNPKLVIMGDDPKLGEYRSTFANMLALLEERPDGNWENLASFGFPKEVISSRKAFHHLIKSSSYQVDAKRYLRSRLFDMWLSDWSRREDQWRWGVQQKSGTNILEPIPRDRDHSFFKFNDGVLTRIVSLFKPNYQTFDQSISKQNVKGLTKASWQMDAYFLAYLTEQDFLEIAQDLQKKLTDEVIQQSLQVWPSQIRKLSEKEFTIKLKGRRNDLSKASSTFYQMLNRNVLLPGTDEKDTFVLNYLNDGSLAVQVFSKKGKRDSLLVHERIFYPQQTKSISFYGLGREDTFEVKGKGNNAFNITWVGGEDTDKLLIDRDLSLSGKKIVVLDERDGNEYQEHREHVRIREHTPAANEFNGEGWLLRHRLH